MAKTEDSRHVGWRVRGGTGKLEHTHVARRSCKAIKHVASDRQLDINNAKILATRLSVDEGKSLKDELIAEEERSRRFSRIKRVIALEGSKRVVKLFWALDGGALGFRSLAAATALVKRHADGSLPVEDFNLELEDQNGQKIQFGSETDRRAMMMGLMLHANAKSLIKREMYRDALEVLTMGEEAFSLCNPKVIELVDNVPILQIDMVWCYFLLQDISWLSVAGVRLEKAREGIQRSHGKDSSRMRLLQAGRYPELALHLRMELLEGVVAYHSGQFDKSRKALSSAQAKFFQLQVPDEALSLVISMGFSEHDAKRALRISNQDVGQEQKKYGVTPLKKAVDLQNLKELVSIGFEKELACQALRRNENDTQKALDDLTNPETNSALQVHIESRKRKRRRQAADATIEQLVSMGFERSKVVEACQDGSNFDQAMARLLEQPGLNPTCAGNNSESSSVSMPNNDGASSLSGNEDVEGTSTAMTSEIEERDAEMEGELANELTGDAFSDYDIEVTKEGEAINEYLALLESAK
ncbi:hypothetical protein Patl1_13955 [Pistacia atlantica]|uniref:Uncharacterized protein n=1 Tax=Pistacia atlantica TaxID=434234 RepID=A0ACC1AU15_9ROSI|nr:hypothetical protein Patl1_13955 [Pistacia atlantica]